MIQRKIVSTGIDIKVTLRRNFSIENRTFFPQGVCGEGRFCRVYKVEEDGGSVFAFKIIRETEDKEDKRVWESLNKALERERDMLEKISGKGEFCITLMPDFNLRNALVMRYYQFNLVKWKDTRYGKTHINPENIQDIMERILRALDFLKKQKIVHGNLTPSNCLMNTVKDLVVSDFGLAFEEGHADQRAEVRQSGTWSSPEEVLGIPPYTHAMDTWSAGVIFLELLLNKQLFECPKDKSQIEHILEIIGHNPREKWNPNCVSKMDEQIKLVTKEREYSGRLQAEIKDEALRKLVMKILKLNPKKRGSPRSVLVLEYFEKRKMEKAEKVPGP
jgi:serine/threonine protein kinase